MISLVLLACTASSDPAPPSTAGSPPAPPAATAPAAGQEAAAVVATWSGGQVTYQQVQEKLGTQLTQLEVEYLQRRYQLESQATDEVAMLAILDQEAKKRGTTTEGLLKLEVEDKVPTPTDAEVAEFYPLVARQLRNAPLEMVKDQVAQALLMRKQSERMEAYIVELKATYGMSTQLPYPNLPRIAVSVDDDPSLGPANAQVTIVEFADYQCGYCRKVYPTLRELLEEYEGKVRLVYRDYPLGGPNPQGMTPSIAANCAASQGKYWEMHDQLMRVGDYTTTGLESAATAAGLDLGPWKDCTTNSQAQVAEITADFEAGQAAGVNGTPAFFVNGVFLNGAVPKEQFKAVIDRELGG